MVLASEIKTFFSFRILRNILKGIIMLQFLFSVAALGQNQTRIDSLTHALSGTDDINVRWFLYKNLFKEHYRTDIEKANYYNQQTIKIAFESNDRNKIAIALFNKGSLLKMLGKYDSSLILFEQAEDYFRQISDTLGYADCLSEKGNLYLLKKDFKNSFIQLMEALRVYRSTTKKNDFALIYNQIGMMYRAQKQYDSTLKYYNLSLEINERLGFKLGSSVNLVNIGTVYEYQKDYTTAIDFYKKSLLLKQELGDKKGMMKCMTNIGNALNSIKDFKNAISYHENALALAKEYKSSLEIATCLINLGNDFQNDNAYSKAVLYAMEGNSLAMQINDLELLKESSRILAQSNNQLRKYQDAYHYYELYKLYSDSIVKQNNLTELAEVQSQYENVKQENEITFLKIDKNKQDIKIQTFKARLNLFFGVFTALLALALFFYYRSAVSKKLSLKLSEINDMKSRFFANLSHEFRTPLTLMLGPAEKLKLTAKPEDKPWLDLIIRNALRLLFLDEQLLEFTRIDSGSQVIHLVEGDINIPLKGIAGAFELFAEKKNIRLNLDFPEKEINTFFDADILEKVTTNLLSNAFKYTPTGGFVEISATTEFLHEYPGSTKQKSKTGSKFIRINVKDNGAGIPEDKKDQIFERFYRLNQTAGVAEFGAGIGLALTRELLQLHHGFIKVESSVGQGSQFSVFLPAEKDYYTPDELKGAKLYDGKSENIQVQLFPEERLDEVRSFDEEVARPVVDESLPQVLVVDDNADMRMYIRDIIDESYAVTEAANGIEGFEAACASIPDLIITDIMMEPVNGIEFCKNLKTDERTSHIPVIMLTALSGSDEKIKGLETGADDYITKPFRHQEILVRVQNLISQRKKLRELFSTELKLEPKSISVTSTDERFLQKLILLIESNIDNPELDVEFLVKNIGMSRSQLHRKITALSNEPVTGFIRIIRIKRAAQLLGQKFGNISEVMYAVGFNNLSYFTKCFREVYNMTPSEFLTK